MKYAIILAASVVALGMSAPAMAGEDSGGYVNIGASWFDVDSSVFGAVARLGYNGNKLFGR